MATGSNVASTTVGAVEPILTKGVTATIGAALKAEAEAKQAAREIMDKIDLWSGLYESIAQSGVDLWKYWNK